MDLKKVIPLFCFAAVCVFGGLKLIKGVKLRLKSQGQNVGTQQTAQTTGLGNLIEQPKSLAILT